MIDNNLIVLEGCLERITYENPSNRYAVAKFRATGLNQLITICLLYTSPSPRDMIPDLVWRLLV